MEIKGNKVVDLKGFKSLQKVNEYLTNKQSEVFSKLLLDVEKNSLKISEFIKIAEKNKVSALDKLFKNLKSDIFDSYKGIFTVFNHVKQCLKDGNLVNKTEINKINAIDLVSLFDFNTLVSIKSSNFNYGVKKHLYTLTDATIEYLSLSVGEQEKTKEISKKVNEILKSDKIKLEKLIDLVSCSKFSKQTAKFAFENDVEFFDKYNMIELYNFEYEQGLKEARKLNGLNGVTKFIEDWEKTQEITENATNFKPRKQKTVKKAETVETVETVDSSFSLAE